MKVFFSASPRGKKNFKDEYLKIYQSLIKMGFTHLNSDVVSNDDNFYENLSAGGTNAYNKKYYQLLQAVKEADIAIFECSSPSFAVGFLIEKAIQSSIPTIALYSKNHTPHFLAGINDDKFQLVEYATSDLEQKIIDAVNKAVQLMDKRFNFFISPQLLTYLNNVSKEQRISKSTFIRSLIIQHMKKQTSSK